MISYYVLAVCIYFGLGALLAKTSNVKSFLVFQLAPALFAVIGALLLIGVNPLNLNPL